MSRFRPVNSGLLRSLRAALGEDHVLSDPEVLTAHSRDWSVAEPSLPEVVVQPTTTDGVSEVLKLANQHQVAVTPRGLGSGKTGGAVPVHGGIVLSTVRLHTIERISKADMVAEVGAGCVLSDIWTAVEDEGLFYPPDPNSADISSIGGNIACNAGGPRALKYGVTKNYVLGLEVVLPTGQIMQVGKQTLKHVTGYDLSGLIVGSEGTLGIVTKAILRLTAKPSFVHTGVLEFTSVHEAATCLCGLLAEGFQPRCLELFDHHAVEATRAETSVDPKTNAFVIAEMDGFDERATWSSLVSLMERAEQTGASRVSVAQDDADRRRMWAPGIGCPKH